MFNLWNGCCEDVEAEQPEDTSCYYAVDDIFCNYGYAPWFYEAMDEYRMKAAQIPQFPLDMIEDDDGETDEG